MQIDSTVASGTLTIEGRSAPYSSQRQYPLIRGANHLSLRSPGFPAPKTCTLVWPTLPAGDCQIARMSNDHTQLTVTLAFSYDDLSSDAQIQIAQQIDDVLRQATANLTTTVPSGALYATRAFKPKSHEIQPAQATAPVPAQVIFQPEAYDDSCGRADCGLPMATGALNVAVTVYIGWRFSPPNNADIQWVGPRDHTIPFGLRYDRSGWQITPPAYTPATSLSLADAQRQATVNSLCADPAQYLAADLGANLVAQIKQNTIDGCALDILEVDSAGHVLRDDGAFITRYGVLLAADAATQQRFPQLPVATSADLAAAAG